MTAIRELMSADVRSHGLGREIAGVQQFEDFYRSFRSAFPRVDVAVEHVVEFGNEAAYRGHVTVTPRGGGPAHTIEGAGFVRTEEGRIVEGWNYYDFLGLLVQAGKVHPATMQGMLEAYAAV